MSIKTMVFILEFIGTVAFASSGAMVGIRKHMDLFGVIVMAITTAVGGGIIRDIILGITPPNAFKNPVYVEIAIATALFLFVVFSFRKHMMEEHIWIYYERLMSLFDAIGLGVFTVIGVSAAYQRGWMHRDFLMIFVGIVTGVGGGVMRDVMAKEMPFIFVKEIYACASLIGAIVCIIIFRMYGHDAMNVAMVAGALVVIIVRLVAMKFKLNLPRIE